MARTSERAPHREAVPRLLFDVETVASILSLSPTTVDQLCRLGELRPSVIVGNRRLFSVRELEQFANTEAPREINLGVNAGGVRE
jgi:Helix-turn-helix domain